MYDAYKGEAVRIKAKIVAVCADLPALSVITGLKGHGGMSSRAPLRPAHSRALIIPCDAICVCVFLLVAAVVPCPLCKTHTDGYINFNEVGQLQLRTTAEIDLMVSAIGAAPTTAVMEQRRRDYGVNDRGPLLRLVPQFRYHALARQPAVRSLHRLRCLS